VLAPALKKIADEYPAAQGEGYANHPLAKFIRDDAPAFVADALATSSNRLLFKGSAGNGTFATVPWLAIFDPLVTTTATKGFYVVFLYAPNGDLFLSLNQGTTGVRSEFGNNAREVLRERASLIRARLPDYCDRLPLSTIDLGSSHKLPRDYEAGHALGVRYRADSWPDDVAIGKDLASALKAYRSLIFRGGYDPSPEQMTSDEGLDPGPKTLTEIRQYRMHRRIERNARASNIVKLARGTTCEACSFDFKEIYGELGEGYIEAHHLRPISSLEEDVVTELSVIEDFRVLCSNCHRMAHRLDDPSDIEQLRKILKMNTA